MLKFKAYFWLSRIFAQLTGSMYGSGLCAIMRHTARRFPKKIELVQQVTNPRLSYRL